MSKKSEAEVLTEVFNSTRQLTRFYISKLKGTDMFKTFEVDGNVINCPYWIVAHLVWSEHFLLLRALGGPAPDIAWVDDYRFGSAMPEKDKVPDIKEVLNALNDVHDEAVAFLKTIEDNTLDKPNEYGIEFAGDKSRRMMIHHVIRHEAIHAGQLSLIAKMQGIETV